MYLKTEGAAEVLVELFQDNRDVLDDLYVAAFFLGVLRGSANPLSRALSLSLSHTLTCAPPLYISRCTLACFPNERLADEESKAWIMSHLEHAEMEGQDFIDRRFRHLCHRTDLQYCTMEMLIDAWFQS